jgi:succinylglutamate desuccinylase
MITTKYPFVIKGENNGKTSVILSGVHGNEICGVKAFKKIINQLKIKNGTVIFDIGNPKAVKKNKRYIEFNLNRAFKEDKFFKKEEIDTYEYKRSRELMKILDSADALLDIHSSLNLKSKKFIICQPKSNKISSQLPFLLRVKDLSKFEKGGTDYYMQNKKKIGICVECGQHLDPKSIMVAKKSILNFLIAMGHVDGKNVYYEQKEIKVLSLYKNISNNFILSRKFKDFEKIKKGTLIGIDGRKIVKAKNNCLIFFAHNAKEKNQECFLLGK